MGPSRLVRLAAAAREDSVYARVEHEARADGTIIQFVDESLFDGSLERFLEVKATLDEQLKRLPW